MICPSSKSWGFSAQKANVLWFTFVLLRYLPLWCIESLSLLWQFLWVLVHITLVNNNGTNMWPSLQDGLLPSTLYMDCFCLPWRWYAVRSVAGQHGKGCRVHNSPPFFQCSTRILVEEVESSGFLFEPFTTSSMLCHGVDSKNHSAGLEIDPRRSTPPERFSWHRWHCDPFVVSSLVKRDGFFFKTSLKGPSWHRWHSDSFVVSPLVNMGISALARMI